MFWIFQKLCGAYDKILIPIDQKKLTSWAKKVIFDCWKKFSYVIFILAEGKIELKRAVKRG